MISEKRSISLISLPVMHAEAALMQRKTMKTALETLSRHAEDAYGLRELFNARDVTWKFMAAIT